MAWCFIKHRDNFTFYCTYILKYWCMNCWVLFAKQELTIYFINVHGCNLNWIFSYFYCFPITKTSLSPLNLASRSDTTHFSSVFMNVSNRTWNERWTSNGRVSLTYLQCQIVRPVTERGHALRAEFYLADVKPRMTVIKWNPYESREPLVLIATIKSGHRRTLTDTWNSVHKPRNSEPLTLSIPSSWLKILNYYIFALFPSVLQLCHINCSGYQHHEF
jgi:hypothetical protein